MDSSMPRYFFDLHDHSSEFDRLGTELDSQRAAQVAAVEFAAKS